MWLLLVLDQLNVFSIVLLGIIIAAVLGVPTVTFVTVWGFVCYCFVLESQSVDIASLAMC